MSSEFEKMFPKEIVEQMTSIMKGVSSRDEVETAQQLLNTVNPYSDEVSAVMVTNPSVTEAVNLTAGLVLDDEAVPQHGIRVETDSGGEHVIVVPNANVLGNLAMGIIKLLVAEKDFLAVESMLIDMGYLSRADDDD